MGQGNPYQRVWATKQKNSGNKTSFTFPKFSSQRQWATIPCLEVRQMYVIAPLVWVSYIHLNISSILSRHKKNTRLCFAATCFLENRNTTYDYSQLPYILQTWNRQIPKYKLFYYTWKETRVVGIHKFEFTTSSKHTPRPTVGLTLILQKPN